MTDYAFTARKPCGCLVAVTVDDPKHKRQVNKDIAAWARDGLQITRHPVEEVRKMKFGCRCGEKK